MYGVTQPVNAPTSTRHWNVAAASEEVNVKVETWELVRPDGPLVMTVSAISATDIERGVGGRAAGAAGATARPDSVARAAVAGAVCTKPIERAAVSIATPRRALGRMGCSYAA